METLYRADITRIVAEQCHLPKVTIKQVIVDYTEYVYRQTADRHTVKFIHMFYIENKENEEHDTFAYVCSEIAKDKTYTGQMVQNILETYEQCLIDELHKGNSISIYGVAKVSKTPTLRIRKSSRLANQGYRVKATRWLRKEINDREDT